MTEQGILVALLEDVKQKIRMPDAIEERLIHMRVLVIRSSEIELLDMEKEVIQEEINRLHLEIEMLSLDLTGMS